MRIQQKSPWEPDVPVDNSLMGQFQTWYDKYGNNATMIDPFTFKPVASMVNTMPQFMQEAWSKTKNGPEYAAAARKKMHVKARTFEGGKNPSLQSSIDQRQGYTLDLPSRLSRADYLDENS